MGKLKEAIIVAQEEASQTKFNRGLYPTIKPSTKNSLSDEVLNQQDWAQYEAEFESWLDAYEASFGVQGEQA